MKAQRSRGVQVAVLAGMLVACLSVTASPQVLLEPLSQDLSVSPPGFVTLVFRITNIGVSSDTFDLYATAPDGWTTLTLTRSVSLQPSEHETVLLSLRVPTNVPAGEYEVVLRAVSQTDPSIWNEAALQVEVQPIAGVKLQPPPQDGQALPGGAAEYWIEVLNRGNILSEFELEVRSQWPVDIVPESVELPPGKRAEVIVRHWVPVDAAPGTERSFTVEVCSLLEPGVRDKATLTTKVLPPLPAEVGGTLMAELPVQLRLSTKLDLVSRNLDSALRLSLAGGVEDGYFSAYFNASPIFGPTPLELDSFSICYRRGSAKYAIGDTSRKLTDLLSSSCRGGSVAIDAEHYGLTLLGGGSGDGTCVGGHLVIGPDVANVGIAHIERKDETDQSMVWSLTASTEPLEDWSLRMEGALGINNDLTSRAFFFNTTVDITEYFLSAEAFSVGTYFPGLRSDQVGIALSQRLRHEDISLSASLSHVSNNVVGDPLVSTTATDKLELDFSCPFTEWLQVDSTLKCNGKQSPGLSSEFDGLLEANFSLTPFKKWPTINPSTKLTWERSEGSTVKSKFGRLLSLGVSGSMEALLYSFSTGVNDQIDHVAETHCRTLTFGVSGSMGALPYSFSTQVSDQIDHVAGTHYRTLIFSEGTGLSVKDFYLFLKLTQTRLEDYPTGQLLAGGTEVSLNFSPRGSPHSVDLTLINVGDDFDLSLGLDMQILEGLELQVEGTLEWTRDDAIPPAFSGKATLAFNLNIAFDLPIPFIVTKGRIEGHAFIDTNANGQYDPDEEGVAELVMGVADTQALTGKEGEFRFAPLPPGDYSLRIVNLPRNYVPLASMPIPVHLEAGMVEQVEVPLVEGAMITGRVAVFPEEEPREGLYLEGTGEESLAQGEGLPNVVVKLTSNEETFLQATDRDGHFQFDRLRPGQWTLTVYEDQLPRFHYLERDVFEFDLKPGDQEDLLIRVFVKRRPIQLLEEGELQVEEKEDEE
ncbi:hypothetical protein KAX17_07975 [Candidatus Bipolaricaulota bacterium]|nr:hypothetical protein [Candidatus Bipolaricaulota bacterium]